MEVHRAQTKSEISRRVERWNGENVAALAIHDENLAEIVISSIEREAMVSRAYETSEPAWVWASAAQLDSFPNN